MVSIAGGYTMTELRIRKRMRITDYTRNGGNFAQRTKHNLNKDVKGRAFIDAWDAEWNLRPIGE